MYVSIMGDSISTYAGYNPPGYAVFYENDNLVKNDLQNVNDTWWAKVNFYLDARLCVNNSYSGSKVSGTAFPAANCVERTAFLHTQHIQPDVILIYMGMNDWGYGIPVKHRGILNKKSVYFQDAYMRMLKRVKKNYPHTKVVCATLMKGYIGELSKWVFPECINGFSLEAYNEAIRNCCRRENCFLADLAGLNEVYETLDGTHPTKAGHQTIADAWIACLNNDYMGGRIMYCRYCGRKMEEQYLFCPRCGHRISGKETVAEHLEPYPFSYADGDDKTITNEVYASPDIFNGKEKKKK